MGDPVDLFLTPSQYAAFSTALQPTAETAIRRLDLLIDIPNEEKVKIVTEVLVDVAVPMLQSSVRELRGIPPELLAFASTVLIETTIKLIRRLVVAA